MRAICQAIQSGQLQAEARVLISNNGNSEAFLFAQKIGLPAFHLSLRTEQTPERLDQMILHTLETHNVQLVILSGYMRKLGPQTLSVYKNRVLNIHPALLPQYGGRGMYGKYVHEAVLAAGEKQTGITVHLVDEDYDHGAIVGQCRIPVFEADTVESLTERVKEKEPAFFISILQQILKEGLP